MEVVVRRSWSSLILALPVALAAQRPATESTDALLRRSAARLGGDSVLAATTTLRLDMITQWLRTNFAGSPVSDLPSYEHNVELRDYARGAWRNTRTAGVIGTTYLDVVVDTVAARLMPRSPGAEPTWGTLNLAYVDERRELFAFSPERLIPALRHAANVRTLPDTTIDGAAHARLAATIDGWPAVVFLRRSDALPTLVRFRADETNDFGLAPWGEHEVEFWYSAWTALPGGLVVPRQRDVYRIGRPYKRMTIVRAVANAEAPADSFPMTAELAARYLAEDRRPMWRVTDDTLAKRVDEHFATFGPWYGSAGAIEIGGRWVVLETAQSPGAAALLEQSLQRLVPGAPLAAGIMTITRTSNGGVPWFTGRRLPVFIAPGAAAMVRAMPGGLTGAAVIDRPRWVHLGSDSLWLEPVSVPDMPGTMAVYSPTLRWLYAPFVGSPTHAPELGELIAGLERRGLRVERLGGPRGISVAR